MVMVDYCSGPLNVKMGFMLSRDKRKEPDNAYRTVNLINCGLLFVLYMNVYEQINTYLIVLKSAKKTPNCQ